MWARVDGRGGAEAAILCGPALAADPWLVSGYVVHPATFSRTVLRGLHGVFHGDSRHGYPGHRFDVRRTVP